MYYMIRNTQVDTAHSSAAKPCIHNNAHVVSTDIASTVKQTITSAAQNSLRIVLVSGHMLASPEPGNTRLSKHA
jgi:hypothetical protein